MSYIILYIYNLSFLVQNFKLKHLFRICNTFFSKNPAKMVMKFQINP